MTPPQKYPHCGGDVGAGREHPGQPAVCEHCGEEVGVAAPVWRSSATSRDRWRKVLKVVAIIVVCGALFYLYSMVKFFRFSANSATCPNRLKALALAMRHYCDRYHTFPPAFVPDKNGKPMHSWRALLLPFLADIPDDVPKELADKYDFNEPWDSPRNRQVTNVSLRAFRCWLTPDAGRPTTSYMMVVGPHTLSDGPHSRKPSEIRDGMTDTIMLVEVADSDVCWAEPKDLEFDQLDFKINGRAKQSISSHHVAGAYVVFCDGGVMFLPNNTPPEHVKAMLTIDGGEKMPDNL
jgi:hypothetical protein